MKAAVLTVRGEKELRVKDVPAPSAGPGELLVRVAACGLCRTDLHYLHGLPTFKEPPIILGHEVAGRVEAIGGRVEGWKERERVLLPPVIPCGACEYCFKGRGTLCLNQRMLGNHDDGGFAEFVKVPAWAAFRLPDSIPLEAGSIVADAVSTPYHAVVNRAKVQPGEWVVIFGCGGVGLSTVQVAKAAGARVVGVDIQPWKLETASALGADAVVDGTDAKAAGKEIRKITGGGADVAFDVIGNPQVLESATNVVKWGGRVIVVGYSEKPATLPSGRIMFREIEVKGSLGCGLQDFPHVIDLVAQGKVRLDKMVTHRLPLSKINEGFRMLDAGEPGLVRAVAVME
jgi:6-hydroxycyclohex-1-ene-1-carbonyl-CoA dehydrogenase